MPFESRTKEKLRLHEEERRERERERQEEERREQERLRLDAERRRKLEEDEVLPRPPSCFGPLSQSAQAERQQRERDISQQFALFRRNSVVAPLPEPVLQSAAPAGLSLSTRLSYSTAPVPLPPDVTTLSVRPSQPFREVMTSGA